ncbi:hypothetical protein GGH16_001847, partial [Coemansia sp. RSA 560]
MLSHADSENKVGVVEPNTLQLPKSLSTSAEFILVDKKSEWDGIAHLLPQHNPLLFTGVAPHVLTRNAPIQ